MSEPPDAARRAPPVDVAVSPLPGARAGRPVVLAAVLAFCVAAGFALGLWYLPDIREEERRPSAFLTAFAFQSGFVRAGMLVSGQWDPPKKDGVWSVGPVSGLNVELKDTSSNDIALEFAFVAIVPKQLGEREIQVQVNGEPVGVLVARQQLRETISRVSVPRAVWNRASPATVELLFDMPGKPKSGPSDRTFFLKTLSVYKLY